MNSPPYHNPYYQLHDTTIVNVHTLLKPQPYQQPTNITHTQHPSCHSPSTSTTEIGSLINQLLESQEKFKQTLSVFANEVSLLKTTLTSTFNHHQPHQELIHAINPFTQHHPPFPSFNNTHVCPHLPSITMHTEQENSWVSHMPSHNNPTTTSLAPSSLTYTNTQQQSTKTSSTVLCHHPGFSKCKNTIHSSESPLNIVCKTDIKIISTVENDFLETEEHTITEKNETEILPNPFPDLHALLSFNSGRITYKSIAPSCDSDLVRSRFLPLILVSSQHRSPSTTSSPEKEVVHAISVTPRQHSHLTLELHDVSIHIFDPGGRLTAAVCSAARHPQFRNFRIYNIYHRTAPSPRYHVSVSLLSLVWEPWDRGKKSWKCKNNFPAPAAYPVSN